MSGADADVAVVGAGFAGLAAARQVTQAGCRAVVLEARGRVGGRTESARVAGTVLDLGGAWAGPTQDHIYRLAAETGVEPFPQWSEGAPVILAGDRAVPVTGGAHAWAAQDLAAEEALVGRIDELAAAVPVEAPWHAPQAREWDCVTAAQWLREAGGTAGGTEIVAGAVSERVRH